LPTEGHLPGMQINAQFDHLQFLVFLFSSLIILMIVIVHKPTV
jgi:hypothetical protein